MIYTDLQGMASSAIPGFRRKSSCKWDADVSEHAHQPHPPSRSNSKSRSFFLSSLKNPARSFKHMQHQSISTSDPLDPTGYGKLPSAPSPSESTQGDVDNDGHSITEENVHVQRAAACCLASYYNVKEVEELFEVHEIERLNFKQVYLSPLPQPEEEGSRQNVLVAVAVDSDETSVYVAFRGNSNLAELFSDVCDSSEIKAFQEAPFQCGLCQEMGSYHKNFCTRLSELVPRMDGLLEFCRSLVANSVEKSEDVQNGHTTDSAMKSPSQRIRLVFCGHSLGGALSQLATVTYLLSIFGDTTDVLQQHASSEEPMSITFGAPLVFDKKAASFLRQVIPMQNRFLNFFQAKDPVPFILARTPISPQLQENFRQLKTKNAVSLTVAGTLLVDRKLGKFLKKQPEPGSLPYERSNLRSRRRNKARVLQVERGHISSQSKPPSSEINDSSRDFSVWTGGDGKDVNSAVTVTLVPTSRGGTRKSNMSQKVSEGLQKVIRRVTHGGKKARVIIESKRQLLHLESDVKKAKQETSDDHSTDNSFAPFGIYKKVSYDQKADCHVPKQVKPEDIVDYGFKLSKTHLKQHKIVTYFHCLVGQGSAKKSNQQKQVSIKEGPLPQLDKAELILIRCETSEKLKGARIIAKGNYLSLALEHKCQVTTFSDKWRLVAADTSRIIFETLRATDGKHVYVSQGELIELARVGHGNRATSLSVETLFGRHSGEFCSVVLRDLAADSAVIDGLKHSVGKVLVLLDTDGPKGGDAGRKVLFHLQKAADLTGLKESFSVIVQPTKGTVHAKKTMIDKGFIAQLCYALCYKPITLAFESEGGKMIEQAAHVVRQHPFTVFLNDRGHDHPDIKPFIKSLNLRTTPLKKSDGLVTIELDSYDQILSCLHALVVPDKHAATCNQGTNSEEFIKTYESDLYEAMKEFYEGDVLRKDKLMENWFPLGLDERSCALLRKRLELLYFLTSAFKVAKEQKLLALIGPENAGKSTLAILLGCKSKEPTGYTVHTADMKSYRLAPDLLAVDFPGTDAPGARSSLSTIWEAFAKLPDRCIVVTPFTGDVTAGSQELPRLAAEKLCSDVMLLVNRVDGILKGPPKAKIWKQYSRDTIQSLHDKFLQINERGGVTLKDVLLCSLDEEDLHDNDIAHLKERGIIFSKDVKKRILHWIKGPNASLSSPRDAVKSPIFTETYSRGDQKVTERKHIQPNYTGSSNSVQDGTISTKPDLDSLTTSRPTSHRAKCAEKIKAELGISERTNPTGRGTAGLDVKLGSSVSSNPKFKTTSQENGKSSSTTQVINSPPDSSKCLNTSKLMASSPERSKSSSAAQVINSPADSSKCLSTSKLMTSSPERGKSSSITQMINSPAKSNKCLSTSKLMASSPDSSKSSDHQHGDVDGSFNGSRNDIGHPIGSTHTSLAWVSRTPSDSQNSLVSPEYTRDQFGRVSPSESSTVSISFEEGLRNDDYRGVVQGVAIDQDNPEEQATSTTSYSSTSTSGPKHPKGQSQCQFAHQLSQRASTIIAEESNGSSSSKTPSQPTSKRVINRRSSGGNSSATPAWK